MRFPTKIEATIACHTINMAFAKRGHLMPVFEVKTWAYGWEVVEIKSAMPVRPVQRKTQ